ncbi:hypothetical protein [Saccharothrix xinjiangensis]|uniref:Uncharacterized protein n=1 Tax=Saccharothrix xinjiangensis TaxID=204798 RepID=A0ABV9Y9H0_9PSEU
MGSDWCRTLQLPPGSLTADAVEEVLSTAERAGFSPHRALDGLVNAFHPDDPVEHDPGVPDRGAVVAELAAGTCATNLWTSPEVDVFLAADPGGAGEAASLRLTLDSCHTWRQPRPGAEPHRRLHRDLTALWPDLAERSGAAFGRVEDDWSVLQVRDLVDDPSSDDAPPPGRRPDLPGWWTCFGADLRRDLPPLPADLGTTVRRTPGGGAVVGFLDDPAAVDAPAFRDLRVRFARWAGAAHPAG